MRKFDHEFAFHVPVLRTVAVNTRWPLCRSVMLPCRCVLKSDPSFSFSHRGAKRRMWRDGHITVLNDGGERF